MLISGSFRARLESHVSDGVFARQIFRSKPIELGLGLDFGENSRSPIDFELDSKQNRSGLGSKTLGLRLFRILEITMHCGA